MEPKPKPGVKKALQQVIDVTPAYEDFSHKADYCRQMAERSGDPELKNVWLRLARQWLSLMPSDSGTHYPAILQFDDNTAETAGGSAPAG